MTEGKNTDELKRKPYLILTEACVSNEASSGQSSKYKTVLLGPFILKRRRQRRSVSKTGLSVLKPSDLVGITEVTRRLMPWSRKSNASLRSVSP